MTGTEDFPDACPVCASLTNMSARDHCEAPWCAWKRCGTCSAIFDAKGRHMGGIRR